MILVSLVICTRNRAHQLAACLDAVARIRTKIRWELVIVDNGSTDGTSRVVAEFAAAAPFLVTAVDEPAPGHGSAANAGWRAARGELISFTDDDCYVSPGHIDRVVGLFSAPEIGYGGGRITLFDPSDYPLTIQLQDTPQRIPPRSYVRAGFLQGANMSFRRAALEQIGGFDPAFGAGAKFSGIDIDAQCRTSFAGWTGAYDPALTVAHHHRRKAAAAKRLLQRYMVGRGAYWAKFLLRSDSRAAFMRNIYWEVRRAPVVETAWSLEGAIRYLAGRVLTGQGSHRAETRPELQDAPR